MSRRILLAGASGLVGSAICRRLLADPAPLQLLAPLRRSPAEPADPRLQLLAGDWNDPTRSDELQVRLDQILAGQPLDAYVCALGTTLKAAGSKAAFAAVDHDLVLRLATVARAHGARQAVLVSSVGADPRSGNFYLTTKGRAEQALATLGFERVDLLRPGLLLGSRTEKRPAEAFGRALAPLFNPLLAGPLRRYRAIAAEDVAAAAVALLGRPGAGRFVHEYDGLWAAAGQG